MQNILDTTYIVLGYLHYKVDSHLNECRDAF